MDCDRGWDEIFEATALEEESPDVSLSADDGAEEAQKILDDVAKEIERTRSEGKQPHLLDAEQMQDLQDEMKQLGLDEASGGDVSDGDANGDPSENRSMYWWREDIAHYGDQYTLIWEPEKLLDVGRCLRSAIQEGLYKGTVNALKVTALSAIMMAATIPLTIVSFVNSLDEAWTVATESADAGGALLADALMSDAHGNRPVVLVGYSTGGRLIASCLSKLAEISYGGEKELEEHSVQDVEMLTKRIESDAHLSPREKKWRLRAATIVRDVVIIGAPISTNQRKWTERRSVVLGRFVNVYNPKDLILALLYRYKRYSLQQLAGLRSLEIDDIPHLPPIENVNVSDLVSHHGEYSGKVGEILQRIGIGDAAGSEEFHSRYFNTE